MKRRRCNALLALLLGRHAAHRAARRGSAFLLRPVGARAVGLGQAVVARRDGSEGTVVESSVARWRDAARNVDSPFAGFLRDRRRADARRAVHAARRLRHRRRSAELRRAGEHHRSHGSTDRHGSDALLRALGFVRDADRQSRLDRHCVQGRPDASRLHRTVRLS